MSIQIQCSQCGAARSVDETLAGTSVPCEECGSDVDVGFVAEPAEVVEVAAAEVVAVEAVAAVVADGAGSVSDHSGSVAGDAGASELFDDDDDDDMPPPRKKREKDELDMTPMVDVTFLLLIFFMVTASFSLQKSIEMPRQTSDLPSTSNVEEETEELDPVELEIDEFGSFLVLGPKGEKETVGKQNLILSLKDEIGDVRDGMRLNIKVHENAKLQFLVDGMDAGTLAGFSELQVTQVDGFD